jgi:hypothetical protein
MGSRRALDFPATHMSRSTIELEIEEKVPEPNAMII